MKHCTSYGINEFKCELCGLVNPSDDNEITPSGFVLNDARPTAQTTFVQRRKVR
jgi:hypothetical protein